jgi:DNA-binding transcriptional ArsR family regulator
VDSTDATLDGICHSLSDPTRRRILEVLAEQPGATTAELASSVRGLTRWAVMKHITVLRGAGLVQTLPEGRRRRHYRDTRGLALLDRWIRSQDVGSGRQAGTER